MTTESHILCVSFFTIDRTQNITKHLTICRNMENTKCNHQLTVDFRERRAERDKAYQQAGETDK